MRRIVLWLLLPMLVTFSHQSIDYRLPKNAVPYHYKIRMEPHLIPGNLTFEGETQIFLEIVEPTENLTLHSLKLEIQKESTLLIGEGGTLKPHRHIFEEEPQFLILMFPEQLIPGDYVLFLKFKGNLNRIPRGFFRDSYKRRKSHDSDGDERVYLAATQFESTYARAAFPCWDEPALKATFDVTIKHFPNYTALSNMPLERTIDNTKTDGKVWSKFETTPLMSTYIVCFTISDFKNITNSNGNFSVWSKESSLSTMREGLNLGLKALPILEEYTGIQYHLPKMDFFAITGYDYGAMENWGLIIIQEHIMSLGQKSENDKIFYTSGVVVHELAHQWFGNLVSPAWWRDIWITEGLATYFNYFLNSKVMNFPRIMDYFTMRNSRNVFATYEHPRTRGILRDVNSARDADDLLTSVHSPAATMMHMLSGLISEEVFHVGIKKMLQRYQFKTVSTDDFWDTMQEAMEDRKLPHSDFDIKTVMEPYLLQFGYPLVYVSRDYTTGTIRLTQKCASCEENINLNGTESKWWIPISFATKSSPDFSSTIPTHWMDPDEEELIIEGVDPEDWIIVNIQSSAFYRVNYDERNWNKIAEYLNSDSFSNIHVLNRYKLLEDADWLSRRQELEASVLQSLVSYLSREVDYVPWAVGQRSFGKFKLDWNDDEKFKKFFMPMVQALLDNVGLEGRADDDFFTKAKRELAVTWTCRIEHRHCRKVFYNFF